MGRRREPWMALWLMAGVMLVALLGALVNVAAVAAPVASAPPGDATQAQALQRAQQAVVGVQALALPQARSNASLGRARQGSGVVIGADGLVLTIGYLILEADQVQLVIDGERQVPARVVAYDVATGFGLVQALAPLRLAPVPLGQASALAVDERLLVASGGEAGRLGIAQLVSRRPFAGYWEYALDDALYTAPARPDHSGAALINGRGELVGIGSLIVAHALGEGAPPLPGNLFVPIDLLPPILAELRRDGRSAASRRAWLGLNCAEVGGELRVLRVNADSPADGAGLLPGDRIVGIDGRTVGTLGALWQALWQGGVAEREVRLDILRDGEARSLSVRSIDRVQSLRRPEGI